MKSQHNKQTLIDNVSSQALILLNGEEKVCVPGLAF